MAYKKERGLRHKPEGIRGFPPVTVVDVKDRPGCGVDQSEAFSRQTCGEKLLLQKRVTLNYVRCNYENLP